MSGFDLFGGSNVIKSRQSGVTSKSSSLTEVDVAINEVDVDKSVIVLKGYRTAASPSDRNTLQAIFVNPTTIRFRVYTSGGSFSDIHYDVIEFDNIKSIQKGINTSNSQVVATINPVDIAKSFIFSTYRINRDTNFTFNYNSTMYFSNSSEIASISTASSTPKEVEWTVVELN